MDAVTTTTAVAAADSVPDERRAERLERRLQEPMLRIETLLRELTTSDTNRA